MYPSTRMLTHSRVPHIFLHTYTSDMTCSPPPGNIGKVRHRTFGKLRSTMFPVSPVQHYSSTGQAYFLQLYSMPVRHTFYSCTVYAGQAYFLQLYSCCCRGTPVLVVPECTSSIDARMYIACTHTWCQSPDVHRAVHACTAAPAVHTAATTAVLVYPWSTNQPERTHSVHVYRPMRILVLNFFCFRMYAWVIFFMNHVYCDFVYFYIMKIVSHWCYQASTAG